MIEKDLYRTIGEASTEILFKDRKSKFYGYAFPVRSREDVKTVIESLRKKHHTANHVCYAWQLGENTYEYRANDDGEPKNSAGMPIYGQIQSFELTNILVVVVRYFGGTKLGVGGLISAYKSAARLALGNAKIIEKTILQFYELKFNYSEMDIVMRTLKQNNLSIVSQHMELDCCLVIGVPLSTSESIYGQFLDIHGIMISDKD